MVCTPIKTYLLTGLTITLTLTATQLFLSTSQNPPPTPTTTITTIEQSLTNFQPPSSPTHPQCTPHRDTSPHNFLWFHRYKSELPTNLTEAHCLPFRCENSTSYCSPTDPTSFDGPHPPCCSHILRDMARSFDEAMCELGLDYVTVFGTLLGFARDDHIIPWTFDNDYAVSREVANAMVDLWDEKKTGMTFLYQRIPRMCANEHFAAGKLIKWRREGGFRSEELWQGGSPYVDFYVGRRRFWSGEYSEWPTCRHGWGDVWPSRRVRVQGGEFWQRFPADVGRVLEVYYGGGWRVRDGRRSAHGRGRPCEGYMVAGSN